MAIKKVNAEFHVTKKYGKDNTTSLVVFIDYDTRKYQVKDHSEEGVMFGKSNSCYKDLAKATASVEAMQLVGKELNYKK